MITFNNYSIFSIIADFQNYENLDIFLIYLMLIAAIIPIISISKHTNLPDRLAAASSFGSKLSLIIIFYSSATKSCLGIILEAGNQLIGLKV